MCFVKLTLAVVPSLRQDVCRIECATEIESPSWQAYKVVTDPSASLMYYLSLHPNTAILILLTLFYSAPSGVPA